MAERELFVFSGTGNTLHAAERIAAALSGTALHNIARLREQKVVLAGTGLTGICFPVYACGMPRIVRHFLEKLVLPKEGRTFLLLTSAGMPAAAAFQAASVLLERNIAVEGAFHVRMPGNYPPLANPPGGAKLEAFATKSDAAIDSVIRDLTAGHFPAVGRNLFWRIATRFANENAMKKIGEADARFFVTDACVGCGLCARLCPVSNIVLDGMNRPLWKHDCEQCVACLNGCPQQAIEYGPKTRGRNRYLHPAVSCERMLAWNERGE